MDAEDEDSPDPQQSRASEQSQDCYNLLSYDHSQVLQHHADAVDGGGCRSLDFPSSSPSPSQRPQESTDMDNENENFATDMNLPELKLEPCAYDDYEDDNDDNDNLDVEEDLDEDPDQEPEPEIDTGCGNDVDGDGEALLPGEVSQIKRRKSYANSFKLEAIRLAETVGNRKAAKSLGLDESNVREWRKRKEEIERLPSQKRTKRHAKPRWVDLEQTLAQWYLDRKGKNLYVTINMVKEKGMELALQYGHVDFTGSSGWVTRFLSRLKDSGSGGNFDPYVAAADVNNRRHQVPMQPHVNVSGNANMSPEFVERMQTFRTFFVEKRAQSEFKRRNGIITFDEVPIALDMPCGDSPISSTSYVPKTNSSININSNIPNRSAGLHSQPHLCPGIPPSEKIKFTVLLGASASGGKIPPLVIFKEKSLPKEAISIFPEGLIVRCNERGWVTPNIIEDWIEQCWKKWLWPQRSEDNVLILDSCRSHISPEVKFKCSKHFHLQYIPRGMSSLLHPLEIQVAKSFKESVFKQWENWVLDRACGGIKEDGTGIDNLSMSMSRQVENYFTVCSWVLESWKDISPNAIMNGFAKAGIESYTPEDLTDQSQSSTSQCQSNVDVELSQTTILFPEQINFIGDEFDGWD